MSLKKKKIVKYRIAIYIRVSTEEQAENPEGSIKNQEQRLRDYIKMKNLDGPWGELIEVFNDPGISAKDMNRPALKRMLSQIQRGEIDLVLVTEISRLTRSTKDFANLWEFLKEHDCQFQSLRDNFDTTTPAGEMILFTLANFAQFERKQLGERVSNAFQARAKRGLWNGGVLPLGYDLNPEKPGHLVTVPSEAEIIRQVFETFLKKESLSATGNTLNEVITLPRKVRNGGTYRQAHFTREFLYRLLTNRIYIGKRVYETKDGRKEVDGHWEPLIDEPRFNRIQEILKNNKSRKKPASSTRFPYLLTGLVICKACGDRMCGKSAHGNGGKIGYYEHTWATKTQSYLSKKIFTCDPRRILAKRIEPVVWEDVINFITSPAYAKTIFTEAKKSTGIESHVKETEKIKAKITSIQQQIEATTERIVELPKGLNAQVFYDQILKLQKAKEDQEKALSVMKADISTKGTALDLEDFQHFADSLKSLITKTTDPEVKAAICRKLISKIEVSADSITINYHVGEIHYQALLNENKREIIKSDNQVKRRKGSVGSNPAGPFFASKKLEKYKNKNKGSQAVRGSNSLTYGRKP